MSQSRFQVPGPVGRMLSLLSPYPGSFLFATALNLVLKRSLPADVLQSLHGKRLCIKVIDAQLAFDFQWTNAGFAACSSGIAPDLLIGATVHDFVLLARRQEDPDTLFFSRRLIMEGDTELGLLVKNTLDAIELPPFEPAQLAPARVFGRLRAGLRRN